MPGYVPASHRLQGLQSDQVSLAVDATASALTPAFALSLE